MSQPISVQDKLDFPTEVDYHMYIYLSILYNSNC